MGSSSILALLLAAFPVLSLQAASNIYVHSSCTQKPADEKGSKFSDAVNQALDFAEIAANRLGDDSDTDAQNYFKWIFGRDQDKQKVRGKEDDTIP